MLFSKFGAALLVSSVRAHCAASPHPITLNPYTASNIGIIDLFSKLIVNNTLSDDFQYTRDVIRADGTYDNSLWFKSFPQYGSELANVSMVCGRGAEKVLNPTIQTATVVAGDSIGFHLSDPFFPPDPAPMSIYHPGPAQIFLSKLPVDKTDLREYDGSGEWFKIGYTGVLNSTTFAVEVQNSVNTTVPATTPPGKYLARIEQYLPHGGHEESQWFIMCAHIEVVGSGGGVPAPVIKFPGAYTGEEPGECSPRAFLRTE
jgi:hypothetical protein